MCVWRAGGCKKIGFITLPFFVSPFFLRTFMVLPDSKVLHGRQKSKKERACHFIRKCTSMATPSILCQVVSEGWSFQKKNMEKILLCKNNWPRMCATRSTEAANEAAAEN